MIATPVDPDGWRLDGWNGPHCEDWRCDRCFAAAAGEEELAKELLAWWKHLAAWAVELFASLRSIAFSLVEDIGTATRQKCSWARIMSEEEDDPSRLLERIRSGENLSSQRMLRRNCTITESCSAGTTSWTSRRRAWYAC